MDPIEELLAALDEPARGAVEHVLAVARAVAPDAQAGRSYGMAALLVDGRPLLGVRAAKAHLSLHPFSPSAVDAARDQLTGFSLSKGTIRFTADAPPPDAEVQRVVRARLAEIREDPAS